MRSGAATDDGVSIEKIELYSYIMVGSDAKFYESYESLVSSLLYLNEEVLCELSE